MVSALASLIQRRSSGLHQAAFLLALSALASQLLALVRDRLLASTFGAGRTLDLYYTAFRVPDLVYVTIASFVSVTILIPILTRLVHKKEESERLLSEVTTIFVCVMVVVSLVLWIILPTLAPFIAPGFSGEEHTVLILLSRLMLLSPLLLGLSNIVGSVTQVYRRFFLYALAPVLYNVGIIIGTVLFSHKFGIVGPALGVVMGALLHLLAQLPLAYKLGFSYKPIIHKHPAIKEMTRLMLPRMITLSLAQVEQTVLIAFSSWLGSGTVTIITIAQQLTNLPIRLIGVTIGQASLPFFAKETAKNNLVGLAKMVNDSILQMLYLALPASAIILVLRIPLVRLAYGAGSFPWTETVTTGKLVAMFAIAIAAGSLSHIIIRVFYALRDTKTPFIINLISTTVNVGLSYYFLFVIKTGIVGMAFAITLADILETTILTVILYHVARFSLKEIIKPFGKMLLAASITTLSLWVPLRVLDQLIFDTTHTIPLIILTVIVVIIGVMVYVSVSYLLHIRELEVFVALAKKIGDWQSALGQTNESLETTETPV